MNSRHDLLVYALWRFILIYQDYFLINYSMLVKVIGRETTYIV